MNNTDTPFLSRCALILFLGGLVLPPVLYVINGSSSGAASAIVTVAVVCPLFATILAIVARPHLPARIVLIGVPVILCLFSDLLIFNHFQGSRLRAEMYAEIAMHEAEARARNAAQRANEAKRVKQQP